MEKLVETKSIYRADTLEELAVQVGMEKNALLDEINKYNNYIEQGADPDFGKSNFGPKIETAPFYATPRSPSVPQFNVIRFFQIVIDVIPYRGFPYPSIS